MKALVLFIEEDMWTFMLKLCVLLAMAAYPASSLLMEITPRDTIILGGRGTETRAFMCRLDSTDNPSNINGITSMTLYRHRPNQKNVLVRGEFLIQSLYYTYTMNSDLQSRATSIENIDKNNWGGSTIGFTIPVSALRCSDAGTYSCEMNVQRDPGPEGLLNSTRKELKVTTLPNDATMIVTPYPSAGKTGTMNEPISASVDDVYNFECNTNIGSDQTTTITWQYTSELSASFVSFPGNKTNGALGGPSDCQYRTSSKTSYTITSIDISRRTLLAIRCTVKVVLPYRVNGSTEYEMQNPPTLYFKVGSMSDQLCNTCQPCKTSDLSLPLVVVTIVIGVCLAICIVIIVIQRRQLQKGTVTTTAAARGTTTLSSVNTAYVNELDTTRSDIRVYNDCVIGDPQPHGDYETLQEERGRQMSFREPLGPWPGLCAEHTGDPRDSKLQDVWKFLALLLL